MLPSSQASGLEGNREGTRHPGDMSCPDYCTPSAKLEQFLALLLFKLLSRIGISVKTVWNHCKKKE